MHNLKPKKRWGQHFLHDQRRAQQIVDLLEAAATDQVVEIGPGPGVLTRYLVKQYPRLTVVEVDPEAVALLKKSLDPVPKIVEGDVLKWDIAANIEDPAHFIGNLPYNISSPFFFKLLENRDLVKEGVFMIQKEVAERICAGPGNKTYGILSVLLGTWFERKYCSSVPPGAFTPPPKVMSGVIKLTRKKEQPDVDYEALRRLVKAAFQQRRKTLRNALKGFDLDGIPEWKAWSSLRAEQLAIEQFWVLAGGAV